MSQSANYENFSTATTLTDDDSFTFDIAAQRVNSIRHMVALGNSLIALTSGCAYNLSGASDGVLTPSSIEIKPQEYRGCSKVRPEVIGASVLYIQDKDSVLRTLGYQLQSDSYISSDLTTLAKHLFVGHTITSMCYQQTPDGILWLTRDDGVLLGLTYLPEHQIYAWHHHVTDGKVLQVACIGTDKGDEVYLLVERTINGATVKFVERMVQRMTSNDPADAWFVDCGLSYSGSALTVLSGLDHLEGKTVSIVADGNVHPSRVVSGGSITLDYAASKVVVGLPFTTYIEPMPVYAQVQGLVMQGKQKKISAVTLMVDKSRDFEVSADQGANWQALAMRSDEELGEPTALYSGYTEELSLLSDYYRNGSVIVRQVNPMPLTVLAVIP